MSIGTGRWDTFVVGEEEHVGDYIGMRLRSRLEWDGSVRACKYLP